MSTARPAPVAAAAARAPGAGRVFAAAFALLIAAHLPWLRLPYYWDEAGYFIPAALDCFRHGWLVPHSTLPNAHPPLLELYLSLVWRVAGFHAAVTRIAMLGWGAALLGGVYRLAAGRYGERAGLAAAALLGCSPLFFAQAGLAQLDLPAAALVVWALAAREERSELRYAACAVAACLMKDTAVLMPLTLFCLDAAAGRRRRALAHLPALAAVCLWYAYVRHVTGFWFGNPGYVAYNLGHTAFSAGRIGMAFLRHVWQLGFYEGVGVVTLLGARRWRARELAREEWAGLTLAYLAFHSLVGGAVLARYLLPVQALLFARLAPGWLRWKRPGLLLAGSAAFLMLNWFWNPPYAFAFEDNLAYTDFVRLHQAAAATLAARAGAGAGEPITTAWPATDELHNPDLGYVKRPLAVDELEDFTSSSLPIHPPATLYLYSRLYAPSNDLMKVFPVWKGWSERYFGVLSQVQQVVWLQRFRLQPFFHEERHGQWVVLAGATRSAGLQPGPVSPP